MFQYSLVSCTLPGMNSAQKALLNVEKVSQVIQAEERAQGVFGMVSCLICWKYRILIEKT